MVHSPKQGHLGSESQKWGLIGKYVQSQQKSNLYQRNWIGLQKNGSHIKTRFMPKRGRSKLRRFGLKPKRCDLRDKMSQSLVPKHENWSRFSKKWALVKEKWWNTWIRRWLVGQQCVFRGIYFANEIPQLFSIDHSSTWDA